MPPLYLGASFERTFRVAHRRSYDRCGFLLLGDGPLGITAGRAATMRCRRHVPTPCGASRRTRSSSQERQYTPLRAAPASYYRRPANYAGGEAARPRPRTVSLAEAFETRCGFAEATLIAPKAAQPPPRRPRRVGRDRPTSTEGGPLYTAPDGEALEQRHVEPIIVARAAPGPKDGESVQAI